MKTIVAFCTIFLVALIQASYGQDSEVDLGLAQRAFNEAVNQIYNRVDNGVWTPEQAICADIVRNRATEIKIYVNEILSKCLGLGCKLEYLTLGTEEVKSLNSVLDQC